MLTPWPYQGSKRAEIGKLRPLIRDNIRILEPFIGSGIVSGTFACSAIVNDGMFEIAELWTLLKNRDKELIDFLLTTLTEENRSETLYYELRDEYNELWKQGAYPKRRVLIFIYLLFSCHAAMIRFGPNGFNTPFKLFLLNGRTYEIKERMKTMFAYADKFEEILNADAIDVLKSSAVREKIDLIYCDPPYIESTGYDGTWTYDKLREMDEILAWHAKNGIRSVHQNYPNAGLLDWTKADHVLEFSSNRMVGTYVEKKDDVILIYGDKFDTGAHDLEI
ncbi:DNA adenine methylase protein [Rhizobium phage RHph_Y68]|uniref:site-specific DNA-methyltransferase (adenine-specific) n=1 Tax=Rhizobium phage RHph_Y68 TaxID=2509787 RepID=A0A7S5QYA6_9CAUD|nr:DNA adenine methylase protein [Rhizobium phage RHph_Y68]QIG68107.1 DNA adenine methylase protein [Rhizobium phage RHph_Y68]